MRQKLTIDNITDVINNLIKLNQIPFKGIGLSINAASVLSNAYGIFNTKNITPTSYSGIECIVIDWLKPDMILVGDVELLKSYAKMKNEAAISAVISLLENQLM